MLFVVLFLFCLFVVVVVVVVLEVVVGGGWWRVREVERVCVLSLIHI